MQVGRLALEGLRSAFMSVITYYIKDDVVNYVGGK